MGKKWQVVYFVSSSGENPVSKFEEKTKNA
jgi:hypothetical protein